jgi:S1-C subfamily serine protease
MSRETTARQVFWGFVPLILLSLACQSNHLASLEKQLTGVADQVGPSVVAIKSYNSGTGERKLGAGVVIGQDLILTTETLVGDATRLKILFQNGEEVDTSGIEEVCSDYETNICFIKLKRKDLQPVKCVEKEISPGSIGIVVGNSRFTKGLDVMYGTLAISSLDGEDPYDSPLLALHASLGDNSGGTPVFNHQGELIGIAEGRVEDEHPVTFLLPTVTCQKVMQVMEANNGKIKRGWIGVFVGKPCPLNTVGEGVDPENIPPNMISQMAENSLAEKADLEPGDLIVACHGKEIKTSRDLREIISMQNPGSKVEIMAVRKGEKFTTMVEIGEAPVHQSLRRCTSRSI